MKRILLLLFLLFPGLVLAQGEERILSYDSFIKIMPAGDMTVTETIRVVCEGQRIKRGIYRDFPTRYKDKYQNNVNVAFDFLGALRDGQPEPWRTENRDNGVRVYVGQKDVLLKPGEYTYTLTYRTGRQLGFFEKHDELYWNVTGNDWEFPMEKVQATVELPAGAEVLSIEAYTGLSGQKGIDFTAILDSQDRAQFSTTRPFLPREGLTIVVQWPKGFVREPTRAKKAQVFFLENGSTLAGGIGILVLFIYYFINWLKIGRDPEKGVIIPLYEAPFGLSPAAIRYIMRMGFDDQAFTTAIVNMAVKGFVTITEDEKGVYTLTRKGKDYGGLSRDETRIAQQLFRNKNALEIKAANHSTISQTIKDLRNHLRLEYEKIYFRTNRGTLIPGLILSVLTLLAIILLGRNRATAGFMTLWLSGWTAGTTLLTYQTVKQWRGLVRGQSKGLFKPIGAVFQSFFALPFLAGEVLGLWLFSTVTSLSAILAILIIVLLNILFYHFMKAFTIKGRKVMDQIEGLRLYLSVAEKDRLQEMHPPEKTPEIFEKFLPYALALDVEQEWSKQFSVILSQATEAKTYTPTWYSGSHFATEGVVGLTSSLGAMSTSISSSSSPPGSSSGGGGGGSSGGGGGGGGGGGW
ncbi:MAG: DUF2207 domain-containing protein [Thermodesulfobacteriota bacterium]